MNTDDEVRLATLAMVRDEDRAAREQDERDAAAAMRRATEPRGAGGKAPPPDERTSIAELQLRYDILARGRPNDDARRDFALDMLDSAPVLLEIAAAALEFCMPADSARDVVPWDPESVDAERLAAVLAKVRP